MSRLTNDHISIYFNSLSGKLENGMARDSDERELLSVLIENKELIEAGLLGRDELIFKKDVVSFIKKNELSTSEVIQLFSYLYFLSVSYNDDNAQNIRRVLICNKHMYGSESTVPNSIASIEYIARSRNEIKKEVDALKVALAKEENKLKNMRYESNFVGLSEAFQRIYNQKNEEKKVLTYILCFLGVLLLLPFLLIQLGHVTIKNGDFSSYGSAVGYELVMFYFFRVVLKNYYFVKSHILQLSLRTALFSFIESYVDFSSKISDENNSTLSKFEDVIFHEFADGNVTLPSTVDGVEQLIKLIKK